MIRKDYLKGFRSDGEHFVPDATKPAVVFYTTSAEEGRDIWAQDFPSFTIELADFLTRLEVDGRAYRVFGFWPGKSRSDIFPMDTDTVRKLCGA